MKHKSLHLALICLGICLAACQGPGPALDQDSDALRFAAVGRARVVDPMRFARREAYLELKIDDRSQLRALGRMVSIDRVDGLRVRAYASPEGLAALDAKGIAYTRLVHPGFNPGARMGLIDRDGRLRWDHFPTYSEYVQVLQQLAADHPDICRLHEIGPTTNQQRPHSLWALEISDNPDLDEDEPEVFLTGSMHGDETVGYMNLLRLAEELATGYGSDARITALVDEVEIWINPSANPDGTYYSSDSSVDGAIRGYVDPDGTASWVDPNRNFPDPVAGDHPDGEAWWGETQAMMAFAAERHLALSANFHGGAEVVNFPWDHKAALHPDDAWFYQLSRDYADRCQADGWAGYMTDLDDGVTNGYAWYFVDGGRQDYHTYFMRGREVTIEVSSTKNPSAGTLDSYYAANREALLGYLEDSLEGVRGLVTDPQGAPIEATVSLPDQDQPADRSEIQTDPDVGDYHRLLLPGTYRLRFSALGYHSQEFPGVVVNAGAATRLDVVLQPSARTDMRGQVVDENDFPVPGAQVEFVGTPYPAFVTSRGGYYQRDDLPEDLYHVRVTSDGFQPLEQDCDISQLTPRCDLKLKRLMVFAEEDFELGPGDLTASGSPAPGWQWGVPAAGIGAHSGARVWATALSADYPDDADWRLESSPIALPPHAARLTFWHRYDIESSWDGGNLQISTDGGTNFTPLTPEQGYPDDSVSALGGPGYSGSSGGWVQAAFDLSAYGGQSVVLRWAFASDGSQTEPGWFIDDLQLTGRKIP